MPAAQIKCLGPLVSPVEGLQKEETLQDRSVLLWLRFGPTWREPREAPELAPVFTKPRSLSPQSTCPTSLFPSQPAQRCSDGLHRNGRGRPSARSPVPVRVTRVG